MDKQDEISYYFHKSEILKKKYEELSNVINHLIDEKEKINVLLNESNREICKIQGHTIYEKTGINYRKYGYAYICSCCGEIIPKNSLPKDYKFMEEKDNSYKRILYKKSNFTKDRK